ncbi:MAG: hypothetical protein UU87_C0004G0027 [Parcubacteria group bacterium GW2011_GWA2_42_11]|nr:MAG: hypothetical protein UU87_C0004G0027 [Parcubacteria group bacterium GW2011_GWA2_42_11]
MDFSQIIFVGITNHEDHNWRVKMADIEKLGISEAALFLEQIPEKAERQEVYKALEKSCVKKIPLVHIRNEMDSDELELLCSRYNNPCLTIHEDTFACLDKWRDFQKNLFLEMNFDGLVPDFVKVEKIGGFCVDLAHFKAGEEKWSDEFLYTLSKQKHHKYFACNHVSGYSYEKNKDVHRITDLKQFDYLKTLPKFLFSQIIAIETHNSIAEQLEFKKYLIRLLNQYFL